VVENRLEGGARVGWKTIRWLAGPARRAALRVRARPSQDKSPARDDFSQAAPPDRHAATHDSLPARLAVVGAVIGALVLLALGGVARSARRVARALVVLEVAVLDERAFRLKIDEAAVLRGDGCDVLVRGILDVRRRRRDGGRARG
jgi:hypothetical protein